MPDYLPTSLGCGCTRLTHGPLGGVRLTRSPSRCARIARAARSLRAARGPLGSAASRGRLAPLAARPEWGSGLPREMTQKGLRPLWVILSRGPNVGDRPLCLVRALGAAHAGPLGVRANAELRSAARGTGAAGVAASAGPGDSRQPSFGRLRGVSGDRPQRPHLWTDSLPLLWCPSPCCPSHRHFLANSLPLKSGGEKKSGGQLTATFWLPLLLGAGPASGQESAASGRFLPEKWQGAQCHFLTATFGLAATSRRHFFGQGRLRGPSLLRGVGHWVIGDRAG